MNIFLFTFLKKCYEDIISLLGAFLLLFRSKTCVYLVVRNVSFSENFAHVLNE